jgi:hypothetical protein
MWIGVVALAFAICFSVTAILLQLSVPRRRKSQKLRKIAGAVTAETGDAARTGGQYTLPDSQSLDPTTSSAQADPLLLCRMKSLDLDPDALRRSDPVLFRQFATRCLQCESKARCARDFAGSSSDQMPLDWREYCPNCAMLNMLSMRALLVWSGKNP